ncbi:hypothetical protein K456DRAFT_1088620 [Colletotrichum gloeosporioides 23]|nr:hypothetical protein K456DRAFT_1088620 [Colletotrichum gloeosporioides 23]
MCGLNTSVCGKVCGLQLKPVIVTLSTRCSRRFCIISVLSRLRRRLKSSTTDMIDRYDRQRTWFTTSERRLGLIAGGIERGDEIWVIQGLDVPVALRCVGDGLYSLVGVVYVHGIMHGEAVLDSTDVAELDLV